MSERHHIDENPPIGQLVEGPQCHPDNRRYNVLDPLDDKAALVLGNRFFPKRAVYLTDEIKFAYVSMIAKTGRLTQSALDVGVSIDSVKRHRIDDEEFGEAVQMALEVYRDSITKEVERRGMKGVKEPIFYMGKKCGEVTKYSDKLLMMLAKRHIAEFRDHTQTDVTVTGGVMVIPAGPQTVEDWHDQNNSELKVIEVTEIEEIAPTKKNDD